MAKNTLLLCLLSITCTLAIAYDLCKISALLTLIPQVRTSKYAFKLYIYKTNVANFV